MSIFDDYTENMSSEYMREDNFVDEEYEGGEDSIPAGCRACGGPYPNCVDSCDLYD